jgi:succinyl-diaminopimelate desuccinylase
MSNPLAAFSLTRRLIQFNTVNPPGHEYECAEYLGRLLEDGGFKTDSYEYAEKRTSLIARIEGRDDRPPICFTGHIDTAPLGAVQWEKDPFSGETDGDNIYGRGASDMKGGVAAMILAALEMAKTSNKKAGMTLVVTASEETGSHGAYHLAEIGRVLGSAGALVVGEPTSNYPFVGHKGSLWIKAGTTGITAHGSMPDQGVNAIYKAARAVDKLEQFKFAVSPHSVLGPSTLNVGTISGGMNINSVPDMATIGIDVRTVPGQSNADAFEELKSCLGDDVALERVVDVESVWTDPRNGWVQQVYDIMEKYLKQRPVAKGATYFTDASVLTPAYNNTPTIILGPGEPSMAHKTDEYCSISKIEQAAEAYLEIAKSWCGG